MSPASVTIMDKAEIEARQASTLTDLVTTVPGVAIGPGGLAGPADLALHPRHQLRARACCCGTASSSTTRTSAAPTGSSSRSTASSGSR